jgi:hypothetical protein
MPYLILVRVVIVISSKDHKIWNEFITPAASVSRPSSPLRSALNCYLVSLSSTSGFSEAIVQARTTIFSLNSRTATHATIFTAMPTRTLISYLKYFPSGRVNLSPFLPGLC